MNDETTEETYPNIDEQIANLEAQMLSYDGFSEEYSTMLRNIKQLYDIKLAMDKNAIDSYIKSNESDSNIRIHEQESISNMKVRERETDNYVLDLAEKQKTKPFLERINPDVIVSVGGNLAGILLILNYEKMGVITSKAFNTLLRVSV